jgi:uncharacterized membrane protein YccC
VNALWARLGAHLQSRHGDFRHAVRVAAACAATFAIMRILNIPGGQWAVFTTVIVMQTSIGGTIAQAVERLIGTMVGAVAGAAAVYAQEVSGADQVLVLSILVAFVAFVAGSRPTLRAAPLTAVIMLVAHPAELEPAIAALYRVGEILLGGVTGVAATLLIFPAHAHAAVVSKLTAVFATLEAILASHASRLALGGAGDAATPLFQDSREQLGQMQTAMGEAARESASRLGSNRHSDATARTTWRVRNDLVSLGRALSSPLPVPGMIAPGEQVLKAYQAFLATCREHLTGGPRPDRIAFAAAHEAFQDAVQALRDSGVMRGIPYDDLAQAFGFVFAVDALYANLSDLSDRLEEDLEAQKG